MAEARAGLLTRFRASAHAFAHGVHPPESKELTAALPIRRMPYPDEVVLPVRQHAGKPARVIVRKGAHVERGDVVAEADGFVSSPVHASASGRVVDVALWPHPDGSMCTAVRIAVDRWSAQIARPRVVPEWDGLTRAAVVRAVQDAGVVGLGGAAFPTHVKLVPPADAAIDTLVVNGAECEPYLTTDHRIMVEYPRRVLFGVRIMMHALGAKRCVIGVERNKPDAIAALRAANGNGFRNDDVEILPLTVKYPQGAEKMLLKSVLGREVASGQLPASVGAIVQNVGSIATIAEVFETGLPLVERIVTVSGHGVRRPANLIVPVGTKVGDLLAHCGGLTDDAAEVLFGGPMMGTAVSTLDAPILKGTTGVVVLTHDEVRDQAALPCIHCGRCLDACPMFLNPSLLGDLARAGRHDEMAAEHLSDCMLCGSCSYVCPSNIPLAQLFAASKSALRRRVMAGTGA
ncbi:Electron transport complex protein rnfC (plasmid) [Gemmatirosa kalamazoonensis]|uniref:Ion-translocating oxidoreductase complex subunit C n=1 Tax=Gemmatirosa kalamazoonensis TaxID=861299 RepID=W0RQ62_9BACT|nr:electron transport complex subunit RsxC [Gemmatirosa kalamazoonensis]AHG92617.1 Electron transport complex protein rnfC [Gemmatirosa kalamazoonensis]